MIKRMCAIGEVSPDERAGLLSVVEGMLQMRARRTCAAA
jgi:hypothetical protein